VKYLPRLLLSGSLSVLAAASLLFYWAALRPLPVTSGVIKGPGFPAASAGRDKLGIPHIQARSAAGAVWVQGYVTAQDRLWQMDILRRLPAGELAEVFGPSMLAADRESRTLGARRNALAALEALPPGDREWIEAYRRGVNAFLDSHQNNLPVEFHLLRYRPRSWEAVDSLLVGMYMFRTLTNTWREELMKRALLERASPERVRALLPVWSGREVAPGSNAWAVSGARTATGKPLLANDPHLGYSIPCIWYTVHLQAPDLNVIGVSVPGFPGIIIGHNDRIAWGATNLQFDVQDLYLSPAAGRTAQEVIHVKGRPDVVLPVEFTRYGPVVAEVANQKAALRWTAADPSVWQAPFLELDRARNWQDFRRALSRYGGPPQNWVYADRDGNIGYQAAGKLPVRRGFDGSLPVPGGGKFDWQGYIPFDALPRAYNPASGMIVTANQNPFPQKYPYAVNGNFAPHFRSNRIRELLEQGGPFQPADFLRIQTDVYSPFGRFFARQVLEAADKRKIADPELLSALAQLRSWDGRFLADESAPVLVAVAYNRFLRLLLENAVGDRASVYASQMAPAVVEQVLAARPPGWTGDPDYDDLLIRSLSQAIREVKRLGGAAATWGRYLQTTIAHPVGHRIPFLRRWFDIGPFPQSGTTTTIKQTTERLGPSMRLVVDLSDLDRSLHHLTTGESGQPFSPHYKDQWLAYYSGAGFPLPFSSPAVIDRLEFRPQ
jgi:penicillin amidase